MVSQSDQDSLVESLQSLSRGAVVFIAGSGFSKALGFVLNVVLTQSLGAAMYGVYAFSYTILTILADFGTLGSDRAILRFLPTETEGEGNGSVTLFISVVTALVGSSAIAAVLFWLAPVLSERTLNSPLFTDVVRIFAVLVPFHALTDVILSVFRSQERLEYQVFVRDILNPIIKLLTTGIAILIGATLIGVVAAIAVTVLLIFAYTGYLLISRSGVYPTIEGYRTRLRPHYNFSFPLAIKDVGGLIVTRIDILMIGFLLTGPDVGIYNIAVLLSGVLLFPLRGINQLVPPIISRLYKAGDFDQIQSIYGTASRWGLIITLLPAIGIAVYRETILSLFGASFLIGGASVVVLSAGYLVRSAAGPSGYVLMMTDHQYLLLINQFLLAALNIVLNYILILQFDILGAAIATATTRILINQVRVVEIWYLEGLFPYSVAFLKPILAGGVTITTLLAVRQLLPTGPAVAVGAIFGSLVFGGALYLLGLEEIDKQFLTALRAKYESRR
ncbi:flippase [Salinibaculum rarum]|uniref:flippase n=1 Tax=Salinibaculum rarum TaxID=3058903 RepID=UPI00265F0505|nr:flippase [Salinibaculum sp. KK48]